jgi:hypothetical protein
MRAKLDYEELPIHLCLQLKPRHNEHPAKCFANDGHQFYIFGGILQEERLKALFLVTWVPVPTISVSDFSRPIGIVVLSVNHMIRNLERALLYLFSSVSVEIALWSHVFLGLDSFPC